MKLFKALKLKNKLVGEIANKKNLFLENNSFIEGQTKYYDSIKVLAEIEQYTKDLLNLKMAINTANIPIWKDIFNLSEAKSILSSLNSLTTTEGIIKHRQGFVGEVTNEYTVSINELKKNELIAKYEKIIEETQDKIDIFNHVTECNIKESDLEITK
jgi:hypothetical protein